MGNSSVVTIAGQVATSTYSDARFKTNVLDLGLGLELINALSPKTYTVDTLGVQEFRADRPGKLAKIKAKHKGKRAKVALDDKMSGKKKTEELEKLQEEEAESIKQHEDQYEVSKYSDSTSKVWCGLIAQEVEAAILAVSPENLGIVDVPDDLDKEVYGMRYSQLIPVLINAVNELTDRIKVLEGAG
jgi:hypothetical protein